MIFRFTLTNENLGALILSKDPQGWRDMETIIKRGAEYHGTFYETMVQLEFACGSGKEYIDEIYETYGVDAVINIKIEINCASSGGIVSANDYSDDYSDDYGSYTQSSDAATYETFFEGTLDLSKYNKNTKATFVDILQSDFIQKVLNRFKTQIEVTKNTSLDDVALTPITDFPSTVTLHSKELQLETTYELFEDTGSIFCPFNLDTINMEIPMIYITDDIGTAQLITSPYLFTFFSTGGSQGYENTDPFFTNTSSDDIVVDFNYNIVGDLSIRHELTSTINFFIYFSTGVQFAYSPPPTELQSTIGISITGSVIEVIPVNAVGTLSGITITAGESLFLCFGFADVQGNPSDPALFEYLGFETSAFEVSLTNQSTTPSTTASIFKIHELGAAISQRITSQEDAFRSTLLGRKNSEPNSYDSNGCGSFLGVLNGKHIRGFDISSTPLFCSMDDFFKTINSLWNCGIGFEKVGDDFFIRLEEKEYFYDTTVILQCPNANEIRTSVAKEYFVSNVLIGYKDWETENVNGLDEFNTKREYDVGIKSIESRFDLIVPMIASMYSIEFSRRQGVSSYDYKYDNDNFIICLNRTVDGSGNPTQLNIAEKDENFDTVNNFKSPETAYNIRISPTRNLLNHMNIIASSITKYIGRAVKFVYGEGNFNVQTEFTNDTCDNNFQNNILTENQDITVAQAGATPIWIPEYIEFEYPLSFSDYLNIRDNPYKCIEVSNTDSNFVKGFIVEVRYKPVGGLASFKLLRAFE